MDDNPAFPVPPRAFDGASRSVEAGASFDWLRQGWAIFTAHPGVWIASAVIFIVLMLAVSIVPLIGQLVSHVMIPILAAGFLHICRAQAEDRTPHVNDLFIGFKQRRNELLTVGALYAAGVFGIAFIAFLLVSGGVVGGMVTGRVAGFGLALGGVMLAGLAVMVLSVPVLMATWFAPALVFFHNMQPVDAMKASFAACAANVLPLTIYSLLLLPMFFFAMLPLGMGLLVLIPVFAGALYASYRDIFPGT